MASNKVSIPGHFPLYVEGSHRCRCPAHQEANKIACRQRPSLHQGDPYWVSATDDRNNEDDHDDTIDTILELLYG